MKFVTTVVIREIETGLFKIVRIGIDEIGDNDANENGFKKATSLPFSMTATKTFFTEKQARNHLSKSVNDHAYKCNMNDSIHF